MNKLLKAFFIGSLAIVTYQLHSISLTEYIQQYGMPEVVNDWLYLSHKNLTDLTGLQDIPNIDQVTVIDLAHNQIQALPDTIFNGLQSLEYLSLSNNQIQALPDTIFNDLHSLRKLCLNGNQIQALPDTIFNGLHNLQHLYLHNNQIQTLPDTIFNGLHNLGELYLGSNQIQTLPSNIFNDLHNLECLCLANNQIQTLPATIFNGLQNLKSLYLYYNQIQTLPNTIFNGLYNLVILNLQGNSFTPDFIPTLTNLLLNLPRLSYINGMPKSEALKKEPFVTLKKLAAANIARNLNKYWPSLHTLPADILDLLPLTEQQRQEIEKRQVV